MLPYQYVNPYYHTFTARSCANILLDRAHISMPQPDNYNFGCDCISGFAMNYQGYCIDEAQCDLWEAFGASINEGAIGSVDSNPALLNSVENNPTSQTEQENFDQAPQNEIISQNLVKSQIEKSPDFDWNEQESQGSDDLSEMQSLLNSPSNGSLN